MQQFSKHRTLRKKRLNKRGNIRHVRKIVYANKKSCMRLIVKKYSPFLLAALGLFAYGCQNSKVAQNDHVITKRFIHKYGYDVSKEQWDSQEFPGQVITTLKNGITVTANYEDGVLHGISHSTFPLSQTLESESMYERGTLKKKTSFNIRGIPVSEEVYLPDNIVKTTKWYTNGIPLSIETYKGKQLKNAEYFNTKNEVEYKVVDGFGTRVTKTENMKLAVKETIENGYPTKRESFHANGVPHSITNFQNGMLHGTKQVFASSGEPVLEEHWKNNQLDGLATYFQNGYKYLEVPYSVGKKNGMERHYVDGELVIEETQYIDGEKHGPSTFYYDGMSKTQWFYNNAKISKAKYDNLIERERTIAIINERSKGKS